MHPLEIQVQVVASAGASPEESGAKGRARQEERVGIKE
jgi:hypothetical protein